MTRLALWVSSRLDARRKYRLEVARLRAMIADLEAEAARLKEQRSRLLLHARHMAEVAS